jgi:small-conductance mechanosensitive channel
VNALSLIVDGRTFTPRDFLGVVMVMSTEWAETLGKYDKKVLRIRPTLMMRDVAFELDVFEGADEADGIALGNAVASAIAGHPVKAVRVEWHPLPYRRSMALVGLQVVEILMLIGALLVALALTRSHSGHLWVASVILLVILVVDIGSTRAAAHSVARERSAAASKLLSEARAALGHAGGP